MWSYRHAAKHIKTEGYIMASFEVRVVNDAQDGLSGVRVGIEFTSLPRGMADEITDVDGSAHFNEYDEGDINVYIDGRNYGSYYYRSGGSITITK